MKVHVLQENLAKGISIVSRAVANRTTLPVLSNILISAEGDQLRLSATNLEQGITVWLSANVSAPGSTTVPARTFSDLINTLPQDRVDLDLEEATQSLNIRCGAFNNDVKCISAEEFPILPQADLDHAVEMNVVDLKQMIGQVAFAAASDDTRPILTGVQVKIEDGKVTFAAADGYRLAVRTGNLSNPNSGAINSIVPAKALQELARIANDQENPVVMTLPPGRNQVIFKLDNIEMVSQLIEGNFPDYNQLIPSSSATRTVLSTAQFLTACKAANIFARDSAGTTRLKITPGDDTQPGMLQVIAQSAETGKGESTVDANVEGDEIEIGFNVKYLVDLLNVIDTPNVILETSASSKPGVVRAAGREDFVSVIMPMHLN